MRIISRKKLRDFWHTHPEARVPLAGWHKAVKRARWTSFNALRANYPAADKVGDCFVFNVGGNNFRLIALIFFGAGRVYVRHVLTHKEYDRGAWKADCGA